MTYTLKHLSNSSYIIEEKQFKDIMFLKIIFRPYVSKNIF